MRSAVTACLLLFLIPVPALGNPAHAHRSETKQIFQVVKKTLDTLKNTQKAADSWEKEKKGLVAKYNSLKTEACNLAEQKAILSEMIMTMESKINEKKKVNAEPYKIKDRVDKYLQSVVEQLTAFIKRDLPFLPEERRKRIESLNRCLRSPDIPCFKKYQRVMEAVEVETNYGRTVEVYQDIIELGKKQVAVDILRLGRLCLFFMTPDGRITGNYDRSNRQWRPLANSCQNDIKKAISIIRKERIAEMVKLPIGKISRLNRQEKKSRQKDSEKEQVLTKIQGDTCSIQ